ncbi:MAG: hypothetical protein P8Y18_05350, partial [Candidatus Bathyarchaeota archaeon]
KKLINYKLGLRDPSQIETETENDTFQKMANSTKSLNLLINAFSEPNPIEILIYGMFVKNKLGNLVPRSREKIEKTLDMLDDAINLKEQNPSPTSLRSDSIK